MPLARINLSNEATDSFIKLVSDVIYDAMVDVANVPPHDKFQIITRHPDGEIIYPEEGYLGITYSRKIIVIQITWNAGRTVEVKKAFYRRVCDEIHAKTGTRKEDVWINLIDVQREDWSFGNGIMHYGPNESV